MSSLEFCKFAGFVLSTSLLFCPNAIMAQAKAQKVKKLFADRGIEKLAYSRAEGQTHEAYEITKDQPLPKPLRKPDALDPSYTVDGKKVAFSLGTFRKSTGIYVMDAETRVGSELWHEHPPEFVSRLAWSHDGTKLAFAAREDNKEQIFVTDSDGSGMHAVTEGSWPSWSVDDTQLVFERETESKGKLSSIIWVANVDGSNPHPVTDDKSLNSDPSWLPNGRGILFASNRDGKSAIYAMDANGGNVLLIMRSEKSSLFAPSISPDGRTLVYDTRLKRGQALSLWIVPLDGRGEAVLLTGGHNASVVWRGPEVRMQISPAPPATPDQSP
jgi:TolB protein